MPHDRRNPAATPYSLVLSARETQVLVLILRGLANKQIAAEVGLAEQSVKQYASTLLRKFDVPNRAALASAGVRLQLAGSAGLDASWLPQLLRDTTLLFAVLAGPELRFVAASQAVTRAVGRTLVGRTLREALPEYESVGLIQAAEQVYASGEPIVAHAVRVPPLLAGVPSFGYRDLLLQALRDDEGEINAVVYFGIDVTEQIRVAN
jgi:DNA-binding CsgD family transcriptional regulator